MTVPFTEVQRGLWFAQSALGDVPLAIASRTDFRGPLDGPALLSALRRATSELGVGTARPTENRTWEPVESRAFVAVDLRGEPHPAVAADARIAARLAAPIDLVGDGRGRPLVDIELLRLADEHHRLVARAHHLVLDGHGALVVMRRAAALYRARHGGAATAEVGPAVDSQAVLLAADDVYRGSARRGRDRAHWSATLAALPDPVHLGSPVPAAAPVPLVATGDAVRDLALDATGSAVAGGSLRPELVAAAVAACGLHACRTADRPAVVLSLPVRGRVTAVSRAAAGAASNVVPIVVAGRTGTVADLLAAVRRTLAGALRHQLYPRHEMLRDRGAAGVLLRAGPVINVFPETLPLCFDDRPSLSGRLHVEYRLLTTGPVADLSFGIHPTPAGPAVEVEAHPLAHDASDAAAHRTAVVELLGALLRAPGHTRVDDVLGRGGAAVPSLRGTSAPAPRTLATILADAPDGDVAATLYARLRTAGVGRGDVVAVHTARSRYTGAVLRAVTALGAAYLPVDVDSPAARIAAIVADARPVVELTDADLDAAADDRGAAPFIDAALPDDVAYLIYTSGSTGRPKAVAVTHRGLASLVAEIRRSYDLTPGARIAHLASPAFDTAIVEVLAAAVSGGELVAAPRDVRGGPELHRWLAAERISHLLLTPAVLATLSGPEGLDDLCVVIVGGDVVPPALVRRWARGPITVRCAYGPTETTCSVTLTEPLPADVRRVPIGRPMVGVDAFVLDSRLRSQPPGALGELYIAGPSVARGYNGAPALTAQRFVAAVHGPPGSRMFRTGDLVVARRDGTLEFRGRVDDQVKIRGFRVEPAEVTAAAETVPGVRAAATVVRRRAGEPFLALYVEPDGGHSVSPGEIRVHLRGHLPAHLVPASITAVTALPLTAAGKLDRGALPEPEFVGTSAYRRPAAGVEHRIAEAFADVLGVPRIGADDDFFDRGGDSLLAVRLAAAIGVGTADVFAAPTPAGLAALGPVSPPPIADGRVRTTAPCPPVLRNVELTDGTAASVIPFTLTMPVPLTEELLATALEDVVARHPMLRARFTDGRIDVGPPPRVGSFDGAAEDAVWRGFDLAAGPPLRVLLSTDGRTVAVAVHHAACDGRSLRVLAGDVVAALAARSAGDRPDLGPAPGRYLDYAVEASRRLDEVAAEQLAWWTAMLGSSAGGPASRPVPVSDGRRPKRWPAPGARRRLAQPAHVWRSAVARARTAGATPFDVARTAVAGAVCSLWDRSDVVIGTPIEGARGARYAGTVGMFVNTLAVPTDPAAGLAAAAATWRSALAAADVPFHDVAVAVDPLADPSVRHPVFDVALSLDVGLALPGIDVTPLPPPIAKCDLHVTLVPPEGRNTGSIELLHPVAAYRAETVDALLREITARLESG